MLKISADYRISSKGFGDYATEIYLSKKIEIVIISVLFWSKKVENMELFVAKWSWCNTTMLH